MSRNWNLQRPGRTTNCLVENDDNEVEVLAPDDTVLETAKSWSAAESFHYWEQDISAMASRHNAGIVFYADAPRDNSVHGFLIEQKDLFDKALRDRLTDG